MREFTITEEQKQIIKKVVPNVEEWIKRGFEPFKDELYGFILSTFKNDEPTEISYELEMVYDEIVYQNKRNSSL